jgi:hypothetical protein
VGGIGLSVWVVPNLASGFACGSPPTYRDELAVSGRVVPKLVGWR